MQSLSRRHALSVFVLASFASTSRADDLLYRYDCDVLPYDPSAGWVIGNPCVAPQCTESVSGGRFILDWPPDNGDIVNYDLTITPAGQPPPPALWVEWRFRSTLPLHPSHAGCDAWFDFVYDRIGDSVYLHGDAAVSFEGGQFILGLALNEFHTYRFESLDGLNYRVSVNGEVFITDVGVGPGGTRSRLQFIGRGACPLSITLGTHNEWDFIRYGTIGEGETIVTSNPPGGILDAEQYSSLDRFTITFDQPNYVYVNEITVEVLPNQYRPGAPGSGAVLSDDYLPDPNPARQRWADHPALALGVPMVIATRRLDNGAPETVEIVLDRPLAVGTTTRFTFNTGGTPNTIEYTLVDLSPCCLPGGACTDLSSDDCTAQGGTPASATCEGDVDADDRDGVCGDACPADPAKFASGQCGCGVSDADTDFDTIADCLDQCPGHDDRIDDDGDGTPDCLAPIIPVSSAWGIVILALLLAIAAKVALRNVQVVA